MKKKAGIATLAVAALATASITLPDYGGGTRLGFLGDFGVLVGDPDTEFGHLDGGGRIAVAPDSSFAILRETREVEIRGYTFTITRHDGSVAEHPVAPGDTLTIPASDHAEFPEGAKYTVEVQDGGWPVQSGQMTFEVPGCGQAMECRVITRRTSHLPPYQMMTKRADKPANESNWDFLNADEEKIVGLAEDETYTLNFRAVDPRYDILRGASPPLVIEGRACDEPLPAPTIEVTHAEWESDWNVAVTFSDSLDAGPDITVDRWDGSAWIDAGSGSSPGQTGAYSWRYYIPPAPRDDAWWRVETVLDGETLRYHWERGDSGLQAPAK